MSWIRDAWEFYKDNRPILAPLLAPLGTILVGIGTITVGIGTIRVSGKQARTAASQAQIAQRQAVTTAFYNATSRLASDKMEERLGGIYTLENISKESTDDYWMVMETMAAFVRERARKKEPAKDVSGTIASFYEKQNSLEPGGRRTDIAAVLTVIRRRDEKNYPRERKNHWKFDLSRTDLQGADLRDADLSDTDLHRAALHNADLSDADLSRAKLTGAKLNGADLSRAKLPLADLSYANLHGADLSGVTLSTPT
jgi:hypothetical protein